MAAGCDPRAERHDDSARFGAMVSPRRRQRRFARGRARAPRRRRRRPTQAHRREDGGEMRSSPIVRSRRRSPLGAWRVGAAQRASGCAPATRLAQPRLPLRDAFDAPPELPNTREGAAARELLVRRAQQREESLLPARSPARPKRPAPRRSSPSASRPSGGADVGGAVSARSRSPGQISPLPHLHRHPHLRDALVALAAGGGSSFAA